MAFKLLHTEDALKDLEIVLDYVPGENPEAAARFGNALLNHVDLLGSFPHAGTPVTPIARGSAGFSTRRSESTTASGNAARPSKYCTPGTLPAASRGKSSG